MSDINQRIKAAQELERAGNEEFAGEVLIAIVSDLVRINAALEVALGGDKRKGG